MPPRRNQLRRWLPTDAPRATPPPRSKPLSLRAVLPSAVHSTTRVNQVQNVAVLNLFRNQGFVAVQNVLALLKRRAAGRVAERLSRLLCRVADLHRFRPCERLR